MAASSRLSSVKPASGLREAPVHPGSPPLLSPGRGRAVPLSRRPLLVYPRLAHRCPLAGLASPCLWGWAPPLHPLHSASPGSAPAPCALPWCCLAHGPLCPPPSHTLAPALSSALSAALFPALAPDFAQDLPSHPGGTNAEGSCQGESPAPAAGPRTEGPPHSPGEGGAGELCAPHPAWGGPCTHSPWEGPGGLGGLLCQQRLPKALPPLLPYFRPYCPKGAPPALALAWGVRRLEGSLSREGAPLCVLPPPKPCPALMTTAGGACPPPSPSPTPLLPGSPLRPSVAWGA